MPIEQGREPDLYPLQLHPASRIIHYALFSDGARYSLSPSTHVNNQIVVSKQARAAEVLYFAGILITKH